MSDQEQEIKPDEWASRLLKLLDEHRSEPRNQLRKRLEQFIDDVQMNVYMSGDGELHCFFTGRFVKLDQIGPILTLEMIVAGDDGQAFKNFPLLKQTSNGVVVVSRMVLDGSRRHRERIVNRGHN